MSKKIAINGFGRIGRTFLRTIMLDDQAQKELDVVAINVGPCFYENQDHFFKYDSLMGTFPGTVTFADSTLIINNKKIKILTEPDPKKIVWRDLGVEWVIESSGCFTSRECAQWHLNSGARKVVITAPAQDEDVTIIPGVNDYAYDPENHHIISLGSCTTNCFAPLVKVVDEAFGIISGMMNTIHAYTNDQVLLDVEHKDPRRARAAALNIIPTHTGAAEVIFKIFPKLKDKLHASAIRVPVPKVSLLELFFVAEKSLSAQAINDAFYQAEKTTLSSIIHVTDKPLVSSDFSNTPYSAIIDTLLTHSMGNFGKVVGWYDNEWGYCCRIKDFLLHN